MKNYFNEILSEKLEIQKSLIGLEISSAKKSLGYWWILESYFLNSQGGYWRTGAKNSILQRWKNRRKNLEYNKRRSKIFEYKCK